MTIKVIRGKGVEIESNTKEVEILTSFVLITACCSFQKTLFRLFPAESLPKQSGLLERTQTGCDGHDPSAWIAHFLPHTVTGTDAVAGATGAAEKSP